MEYVILGLLFIRGRTVYEIKKALEETISLFYSASFGSINVTIQKMLAKGWIVMEEKVENGRNKKVYSLTGSGRQAFEAWMTSSIPEERVKDIALTRMFFMGFMPQEGQVRVLQEYISTLKATREQLSALHHHFSHMQAPAGKERVGYFQLLTLVYGLDYYEFSINWYQKLLNSMETE